MKNREFQEENHEKQGYFYFSDYMDCYIIVLVLGRNFPFEKEVLKKAGKKDIITISIEEE